MKKSTRVFVSYTRRDGKVSNELLEKLFLYLRGICNPFIHAIDSNNSNIKQRHIVKELLMSHMLILIESPLTYESPWVRFELILSKLKLMPVIRLHSQDIEMLIVQGANKDLHRSKKNAPSQV
jgi:hypothetical protein